MHQQGRQKRIARHQEALFLSHQLTRRINIAMNMPIRTLALLAMFATVTTVATAQNPRRSSISRPSSNQSFDRVQLFNSLEDRSNSGRTSPSEASRRTAKEIRQDRAMYEARQRMLRHQRNLWMGYEPLRPQWNGVPSMSSRYQPPTIYIPVYNAR